MYLECLQEHGVAIAAIAVILLILVSVLAYSGLFINPKLTLLQNGVGKLRVAYKFKSGPYKECGPLFEEVTKIAPDHRCMGIYYDDPKETPSSELRYIVAAILSEGYENVDKDVLRKLESAGFKEIEFPAVKEAVYTQFPFPWMPSLFIAMWKVYAKFDKYLKEHSIKNPGACLEIYDGPVINFYMLLGQFQEFLVPEARECGKEKSS